MTITVVDGVTTVSGYTQRIGTVSDLTSLHKYRVSGVGSGDALYVTSEASFYVWVGTSTDAIDGINIVVPNSYSHAKAPVGRWIRETATRMVANSSIVKVLQNKKTVQSIAGLKAVKVSGIKTGDAAYIIDLNIRFVWQGTNILPSNDQTVIRPNSYKSPDSVGRWLKEGVLTGTGLLPSVTTAPSTTTGLIYPIRSVSLADSPVLVSIDDGVILADTSDGNVDITMPDPALIPAGRFYVIRKVDPSENVVTISSGANVLVETYPSITMNNISGVSLISDGSNFFVLP